MGKGVKVLALCSDGRITWCSAPPDRRGMGNCPHIAHQNPGETDEEFTERVSKINYEKEKKEPNPEENIKENPISKEEISEGKQKLFSLLGTDNVTQENLLELIGKLPPEKQSEIFKLGFEYSSYFAFPVNFDGDDEYDMASKIRLSNMGDYKLGAKQKHIDAIMKEVGDYVTANGSVFIKSNFKDGINEDEWWSMMYATRRASINKTVSVADSGAPIYTMQLVEIEFCD